LWHNLRYCPDICLEGLRKVAENLLQDSWCPSQNLNQGPSNYKSDTLAIEPACLMTLVCLIFTIVPEEPPASGFNVTLEL
jgi:hypothetical protein